MNGAARWFCPRCECREVVAVEQEPYGDGMKFEARLCLNCGWGRTIRDDWYPERNGTEGMPVPHQGSPAVGGSA